MHGDGQNLRFNRTNSATGAGLLGGIARAQSPHERNLTIRNPLGSPRAVRGLSRNDVGSRYAENASAFEDKSKKSQAHNKNTEAVDEEDDLDEKKLTMLLITEDNHANGGDYTPIRVGSVLSNGAFGGPRMSPPASPTNQTRKKRRQMDAIFGGHGGFESRRSIDIKKGDNEDEEEDISRKMSINNDRGVGMLA
jgi:hypothetical protein